MEVLAAKTFHFSAPYVRICRPLFSVTALPRLPKLQLPLKNLQQKSCFGKPILVVLPTTYLGSKSRLEYSICSNSSNVLTAEKRSWIEVVGEVIFTAFPVWVALGRLLGLVRPSSFSWVQPKWTVMGITLTMLGMGMTLTFDDLRGA